MDDSMDILCGAADTRRDLLAALPCGTRQHDLGAARNKVLGRAQAVLQHLALGICQRTHVQGCGSTHASSSISPVSLYSRILTAHSTSSYPTCVSMDAGPLPDLLPQ